MSDNLFKNSVKSLGKRTFNNFANRMITKNCDYIYSNLQMFLYDVIQANNSVLNLPVQAPSSVEPKGYSIFKDTVRYRFEIIAPNRPQYDNTTLKQILQGYCNQSAVSYGAYGLVPKYGNVCSIFIDRLVCGGSVLTIDIVYIDNQNAYIYCKNAVQRDRKLLKNEKAVGRLLTILSSW